MKSSGNTILITGGGSGIGEALAHRFHDAGNTVIIAGRRQDALDAAAHGRANIHTMTIDVESAEGVADFAKRVIAAHPALNVLINNAGIMRFEPLDRSRDLADAEATIATNLLGPIRLINALIDHLTAQPDAAIVNVTSGLAFVPLVDTPTYNATKAAIHSYLMTLRQQLRGTSTSVVELVPPYVQTHLMGEHQANDPRAMPLEAFIAEVMDILTNEPNVAEVVVKGCEPLRFAAENGNLATMFQTVNG